MDLDLLSGKTKFLPMPQEILDVGSVQLQNMEKAKKYSCRKNWIKPSKAMEPDVAVECLKNVINSGLGPDAIAGDDDSAFLS